MPIILLIEKGACPVDFKGMTISKLYSTEAEEKLTIVRETEEPDPIELKMLKVLKGKSLTAKELILKLELDWTPQKMNKYLKTLDSLELVKEKKTNRFKLKGSKEILQKTLF